jgi:hypothetical protein
VPRRLEQGANELLTITDFNTDSLVRLTAVAILAAQEHQDFNAATLYPPSAQVALDRITAMCMTAGLVPPASLPALLSLGRTSPRDWSRLPISPDRPESSVVLLDRVTGLPTQACVDWASGGADLTEVNPVNELLHRLSGNCPSTVLYEQCRNFLVEHPVVNQESLKTIHATPGGLGTWKRVQQLYGPVSSAYAREGQCARCSFCQCIAVPLSDTASRCESGVCPDSPLQQTESVTVLRALPRDVRHSLSAAGRVERDVRRRCLGAGASVELMRDVPNHLRISWPTGDVWLVVVSTCAEPALLARRLRDWAPPHAARTCVAVPAHVLEGTPDYFRVFEHHRAHGGVELMAAELLGSDEQGEASQGDSRA